MLAEVVSGVDLPCVADRLLLVLTSESGDHCRRHPDRMLDQEGYGRDFEGISSSMDYLFSRLESGTKSLIPLLS